MNSENFQAGERLVNAAYVRQGWQGRRAHELRVRTLLEQVPLAPGGWERGGRRGFGGSPAPGAG